MYNRDPFSSTDSSDGETEDETEDDYVFLDNPSAVRRASLERVPSSSDDFDEDWERLESPTSGGSDASSEGDSESLSFDEEDDSDRWEGAPLRVPVRYPSPPRYAALPKTSALSPAGPGDAQGV